MALNNLNLATPTLITAPLLVLLFAVMLSWLPAGGRWVAAFSLTRDRLGLTFQRRHCATVAAA
ncbi:MAG: hypothetical protein CM15mP120_11030 [Pseudomonadota bacterium]|nr:MAG: hypothetical protein CM15mP120_11030 [Pseudomonadota bacterium]